MLPEAASIETASISVEQPFLPVLPQALTRLGYLYPHLEFVAESDCIKIAGCRADEQPAMKREVLFALYREKIYADTIGMRTALLEEAMRR